MRGVADGSRCDRNHRWRWERASQPRGQRGLRTMGTRLYVGNPPFDTNESQLRELFQGGGWQVSDVKIITDRDTGRPRGFAFVEMASQADAQAAIDALNGREFGGRALTVNEAREQAPRPSGGGGWGGGGGRRGRGGGGGA